MLRRTRRTRALMACVVTGVLGLAIAPGALAATVTKEADGTLHYASTDSGTNNSVYVEHYDADWIHIYENNQNEPIVPAPGSGCESDGTYDVYCEVVTGYTKLQVDLASGSDGGYVYVDLPTVINGGADGDYLQFHPRNPEGADVPTPGTLNGESGDDQLQSGAGDQVLNGGDGVEYWTEGGDGNDTLNGGPGNDYGFDGGDGNDTINGDGGNDGELSGGSGNDTINGGDGSDGYLHGRDGNDTINGGAGDDYQLDGGDGTDTVNGGADDDYIVDYEGDSRFEETPDSNGNDTLNGDAGNDSICDGEGDETINGGDGADSVGGCNDSNDGRFVIASNRDSASRGNNTIDGGAGNDRLYGGSGNDAITGGDGDDEIYGSPGNDTANGGAGHDAFLENNGDFVVDGDTTVYNQGDLGSDTYIGGAGRDYIEYDGRDANEDGHDDDITVSLDNVANDGVAGENDNVASDVENIDTGDGKDTVIGSDASNFIWTNSGNDTVDGRGGDDDIWGGYDADTLNGGAGNDDVHGDEGGFDQNPFGGSDALDHNGQPGPDVIDGGAGNDNLFGDQGDDTLKGGDDNDGLYGGPGADDLSGGTGADFVDYSGTGDRLSVTIDNVANDGPIGEDDNVRTDVEDVIGGWGNDSITGSAAANTLSGGAGNDTLNARDTVQDLVICGPGVDTALVDNLDVVETDGDDRCERVEVAQIPGPAAPPIVRVSPKGLTSTVSPKKDLKFPYTFRVRGTLALPAGMSAADGCNGKVAVIYKRGKSTISRRLANLGANCKYSSRVTFAVKRRLKGIKTLRVEVRFQGNTRLLPKSASRKTARVRN